MDLMPPMDAIFSTHLGQYQPRPALSASIVLRTSPDDDQDSMIAKLRQQFPLHCKAIVAPVTNIHQWFDHYDTYRHGYGFLHSVLSTIAFQNSRQVHDFVDRWRNENRQRFYAVGRNSGVTFTKAEITEHGSGFLAEAAQQIHYLRASLQYGPSRITNSSRGRYVESYPGRSGSVANNTSRRPRYISPIPPFVMKRPSMPQGAHMWNPQAPVNQMSNHNPDPTPPISSHASTQAPVRAPRPHLSARRVDSHSDPEEYSYQPPTVPSQGAPGLFPYRRTPLSARFPRPRYPSVETTSADPGSRKVFSNDARVLEMQELRSRSGNSDNNSINFMTAQEPARIPSQVHQDVEIQDRTHSGPPRRVDSSLKNDPAVVFVGNKVGNKAGNDNHQSHELPRHRVDHSQRGSEQNPSAPLQDLSLLRQWSNSSTVVTWDEDDQRANSHLAVENRQVFQTHDDRSLLASNQCLNVSPEQLQRSPTQVVAPNHEQIPFSGYEHRPIRTDRTGRNPATDYDEHRVFVRGLPAGFPATSVARLFDPSLSISHVSNVKVNNMRDSRGFAFVTFEKASDAALAVKALDSTTPACLGGCRLLVKLAFLNKSQRGQRRPEAALHEDTSRRAINEMPQSASNDNLPGNPMDQIQGPDSDALVGGNNDQFSKYGAPSQSPDKASSQLPDSMNPNEQRSSKKEPISSSRAGHSKKKSIQKTQHDSSATDLSFNNKAERNTKSKHEPKSNKYRTANVGSLENGRAAADAPVIQTTPGLDPEQFPPLVTSHSTDLSKPAASQPSFEPGVSEEPQVKPSRKGAKAKEIEPPAIKSEKLDREESQVKPSKKDTKAKANESPAKTSENLDYEEPQVKSSKKDTKAKENQAPVKIPHKLDREEPQVKPNKKYTKTKENESPGKISNKTDCKQESSPVGMVRDESVSAAESAPETAESAPETASALVARPTSDADSDLCVRNTNEAQVLVNKMPANEPPPTQESFKNTDIVLGQHVIDLGSPEADRPKATAAYGKIDVARTGNDPIHIVALPTNPASASLVVVESQAEEPENDSSVVSITPQKSKFHESTSSLSTPSMILTQTQPGEDESSVTPTKKSKASIVKTSPVTPSTASGQISSAALPKAPKSLESHRPEVPVRTSSLPTPSTPILTHKKKQKVFTPVKVEIKDLSGEIDQDSDLTDLNPIRNFEHQKIDQQVEKSNISEGGINFEENKCNIEENHENLGNLQKAALPSTEPGEGTHDKEQEDTAQHPPTTSALNLPKKPKRKGTGRRQKSKSKAGRASVVGNETAIDSGPEKPQSLKNLPEPETPYLLDDQYILPHVTVSRIIPPTKTENTQVTTNTSSQATKNEDPQFTMDRLAAAPIHIQAIRDQEIDEFDACDTLEKYAQLKGEIYEPYAAYLQNKTTFSSIHSSGLLTRKNPSEDIQPLAHSAGNPKPPGLAQPLAWADQGPPKFRSWSHIDESGGLPMLDPYESQLVSSLNESESNRDKGKARTNSSQSSDIEIELLGTPDDSDHLPEFNPKIGRHSSGTDTTIDSKGISEGVQGSCSILDKPSKEKVAHASDLPFRQRYPNLDSVPRAKSTMTVLTSSFSPPSPIPVSATAGDNLLKKGPSDHQIADVAGILPEPATSNTVSSISKNFSSVAGTIVEKRNLDSTSSTHDGLILDLAVKTPVPSTPKRRQPKGRKPKGHERGVSCGSVSSSSAGSTIGSATRPSSSDSQHLSEAFAAISAQNEAKFAAELEVARSQAPTSPPSFAATSAQNEAKLAAELEVARSQASTSPPCTPTHRPHLSYAAAALSPTKGSSPIAIGEMIRVGSPVIRGTEDQAFVNLKDRMEFGPSARSQYKTEKSSSTSDPWRVPKGESVWGSGSDNGCGSGSRKGSRSGSHKSP